MFDGRPRSDPFEAVGRSLLAPRESRRATLALLAFAQLIVSLDAYIVVVALPDIGGGLGFSDQTLQTVISAYAVAFGGFMLLGGRTADVFGRRRTFTAGLVLYAFSSLAGGLASGPAMLLAARAAQGMGGALVFPATLALINTTFAEGSERNRALSAWGGAGAAGLVLGVLLGGTLTTVLGWRSVFLVNVPFVAVAVCFAFSLIAADGKRARPHSFDVPGALSGSVGMSLLVFTLVQGPELGWRSPALLASALTGGLLVVAFVVIEARTDDPVMPLALLSNRNLSTAMVITLLFMATFGSVLYFLTLYFQDVHGYTALQTGLAFLLPTTCVVGGSAIGGRMATRFGLRATLVAALTIGAIGALVLGLAMSENASYNALVPGLVLLSFGDGVVYTTMFIAASSGVAARDQGIASGMASTGTQIGGAAGLAVLVLIANAHTGDQTGEPLRIAVASGIRAAVLVVAASIAATILVALNLRPTKAQLPVPGHDI